MLFYDIFMKNPFFISKLNQSRGVFKCNFILSFFFQAQHSKNEDSVSEIKFRLDQICKY